MKLTLLGTGTPTPSLKRASSGYMLEIGPDLILLDHGPGAHHRLLESGKRAVDVTHMLFSHLHYDHCADFIRLSSRAGIKVRTAYPSSRFTDRRPLGACASSSSVKMARLRRT